MKYFLHYVLNSPYSSIIIDLSGIPNKLTYILTNIGELLAGNKVYPVANSTNKVKILH